jgi:hypothetical protein
MCSMIDIGGRPRTLLARNMFKQKTRDAVKGLMCDPSIHILNI